MLDSKIAELADQMIRLQFDELSKQLGYAIAKTQSDAAVRGMGTSGTVIQLVHDHCARHIEQRAP